MGVTGPLNNCLPDHLFQQKGTNVYLVAPADGSLIATIGSDNPCLKNTKLFKGK